MNDQHGRYVEALPSRLLKKTAHDTGTASRGSEVCHARVAYLKGASTHRTERITASPRHWGKAQTPTLVVDGT